MAFFFGQPLEEILGGIYIYRERMVRSFSCWIGLDREFGFWVAARAGLKKVMRGKGLRVWRVREVIVSLRIGIGIGIGIGIAVRLEV